MGNFEWRQKSVSSSGLSFSLRLTHLFPSQKSSSLEVSRLLFLSVRSGGVETTFDAMSYDL